MGLAEIPPLIQRVPHVAFEVDDLEAALVGQEILIAPNSPSPGIRVAFSIHNGAPIEFLEVTPKRRTSGGEPPGALETRE